MNERIRALLAAPWALADEYMSAIIDVLTFRASDVPLSREDVQARLGMPTGADLPPGGGAVAVIPIRGIISTDAEEFFGGVSPDRIGAQFDAAMANDAVSSIVLAIDSPGGEVTGVPELAAKILAARGKKQVVAASNGLMASAAYWIASAADEIVLTPSGAAGSIGVFTMHADMSRMLTNAGIDVTIIKAGKFKAEGSPFAPLSADAKDAVQTRIDETYTMFVDAVAKGRGVTSAAVRSGFGQGRVEHAKAALAAGMIDHIATVDQVIGQLAGSQAPPGRLRADATPLTIAAQSSGFFVPVTTTGTTASGGGSIAPLVLHPSTAAPKAKEQTVSDSLPVAQVNGAIPNTEPTPDAARMQAFVELAQAHGKSLADVSAWVASGKSVATVRDDILAGYAASNTPVGTQQIVVGKAREESKPFTNVGEFYASVYAANPNVSGQIDPRLRPLAAASGLNQGIGSEGGFTVPPQFSSTIWDRLSDPGESLLARTDNYTVTGESLTFNANAETSRATGSRYGGVQGYWLAEADQITSSKPKFRQIKIEPHGLAVLVYVTDKLLKNSAVALGQYVDRAAGDEINFLVTDAIVNGVGAGQPKGLLNSACAVSVAKDTNQAAATITQSNVSKMWARLHPRARANAVWLHNVDIEPQLDQLSTTVMNVAGTENVGGYANKVFDAQARTLKGRPLVACESCATLGTVGDLILTDLGYYATGTQGGVDTAMSMHLRFDYAETAFRFMFAVDGQSWLQSAITPFKGSNTLSSIVTLATRA